MLCSIWTALALLCVLFPSVTLGFFCSPILSPGGSERTSQAQRIPRSTVAASTNNIFVTTDTATDDSDAVQSKIQVYDSVISPLTCQIMHCLLVEQIYWSDGDTVIFHRPDDDTSEEDVEQPPLTQLGWCIHRLLTEIGDISRTVEYWSRDEFMNIPAHVDIDENQFNDNISISCISSGSSGYTTDDGNNNREKSTNRHKSKKRKAKEVQLQTNCQNFKPTRRQNYKWMKDTQMAVKREKSTWINANPVE